MLVGVVDVEVLWFRVSRFSAVAILSRISNLYSFHRLRISVIAVVGSSFTSSALLSLELCELSSVDANLSS
jgi:hypothetical protein